MATIRCDLCGVDDAVVAGLVCQPCAESIGRLIRIEDWAAGRMYDKVANYEQARLLLAEAGQYAAKTA